ncbi:MAG: pyruvate carboxylase subunit B [Sulfolobales archaeon]|nr:pyruvate carboxylase subunit B [Sulfolobales archaeon]MCX8208904.1 pyruvate carboxylase subunit B [Sulfolobales archaeon]MDW8010813.1 pyruvate carboxylase subunit B [Sulfolobales archaeon]
MKTSVSRAGMVKIVDTTLRDAHQSLLATRFRTEDMVPVLEKLDRAGFYSLEVWGGATFDVAIRYLGEDPWERLRTIRENVKKTKLQMLLRGQNLVGYRHYPDDVVSKFVELAYRNGIDVFRIFDALNDVRNLVVGIKKAKSVGAIVQGTICYTISPIHTVDYYVKFAEELVSLDVDMIAIKDMAGILDPNTAYTLVRELKQRFSIPVDVHTHSTSGMAVATYVKSAEAGADIIDTAISPLAFGTAQPGIQTVYFSLREDLRPQIDLKVINEISEYLEKVVNQKYSKLLTVKALMPDHSVLLHQIPGGMITNLIAQLRELKAEHRLKEVLEEVPRVREDLGWPPLVTPLSQIVGTQAVLNVLLGRYKVIAKEVMDYVAGYYGRPPGPINTEIRERVLKNVKEITTRPADLLEPELEKCAEEVKKMDVPLTEENVVTYCLFPDVAREFFREYFREYMKKIRELEIETMIGYSQ